MSGFQSLSGALDEVLGLGAHCLGPTCSDVWLKFRVHGFRVYGFDHSQWSMTSDTTCGKARSFHTSTLVLQRGPI